MNQIVLSKMPIVILRVTTKKKKKKQRKKQGIENDTLEKYLKWKKSNRKTKNVYI